jgi:tyrosine aminotransferase
MDAWKTTETKRAVNTVNFIRAIVDQVVIPPTPEDKKLIALTLGDPSVFGNFPPPPSATAAVVAAATSNKFDGYGPSHGHKSARAAIATKYSLDDYKLTEDDIIITSGCSDALKMIIHSAVGEGETLLIPAPGFPLYKTLAVNNYADVKEYPLLPDQNWECDLAALEGLVDSTTKAIVVNNPSNPCGSNYSREHLLAIIDFAKRHRILIISDEVYANMVFSGTPFTPMASLARDVPVVVCGGIAKQYCCPGWRLGWICFYDDTENSLNVLKSACIRMSQLIVGCNTIIQGALPAIILETPSDYYSTLNQRLESHANCLFDALSSIDGVEPIRSTGAMYCMVRIQMELFPDFQSDVEWIQALLNEEFVFVLPGSVFGSPGFVRVVICAPVEIIQEGTRRIADFCQRHLRR